MPIPEQSQSIRQVETDGMVLTLGGVLSDVGSVGFRQEAATSSYPHAKDTVND